MHRGVFRNPWTIGIATTTVGTVLGGWFLALHWSDVKSLLAPVWDALTDTAGYLSGTVQVHRWSLLVLLVSLLGFAVGLAYVVHWRCRRTVESALRAALKNAAAAPAQPAAAPQAAAAAPQAPEPEPQIPADFAPITEELVTLRRAFEAHPLPTDLREVAVAMRTRTKKNDATEAHAERALQDLCQVGAMRLHDPVMHRYRLTPAGLAYCYKLDDEQNLKWTMLKQPPGPRYA
jgi:hypothetical protein